MRLDYKVSYRNKDGSIQCIIAYKDGDKWRQRSKQGFKTQKESKDWQEDVIKELKENIKVPTEYRKLTWGEFKDIFLEDKKREYSYNSTLSFKNVFTKFDDLNNIPLLEVSYINLKPCIDEMMDCGLSETTIKDYLNKMRIVFNHAIENYEIMKVNPVKVKQYKISSSDKEGEPKKIRALTPNELEDLLSKLDGPDYYFTLIASKCGLRLGEINGLTSSVLDFKKGQIAVNRQWKKISDTEYNFGKLKTKNSYRTVPIPKNYIKELKEYNNTCIKSMDGRIFIDKSNSTTGIRLADKYQRFGYDISVHDLRHTYATTLIANGFDFKTVAELLGDTVEIVIETYIHFTNEMFENAKSRIDSIL